MSPKFTLEPGRIKPSPRPMWYKKVTITIDIDKAYYDHVAGRGVNGMAVNLVLPNGKTRGVGFFADDTSITVIRDAAARTFKDHWDPKNNCEKK